MYLGIFCEVQNSVRHGAFLFSSFFPVFQTDSWLPLSLSPCEDLQLANTFTKPNVDTCKRGVCHSDRRDPPDFFFAAGEFPLY